MKRLRALFLCSLLLCTLATPVYVFVYLSRYECPDGLTADPQLDNHFFPLRKEWLRRERESGVDGQVLSPFDRLFVLDIYTRRYQFPCFLFFFSSSQNTFPSLHHHTNTFHSLFSYVFLTKNPLP
ncbi:hypothetical protein BKA57DRAFT_91888 [Linnemannia elongata]|nr:hypothetical protein BKA57DRAFT_91888 [Linnemannia elongata]